MPHHQMFRRVFSVAASAATSASSALLRAKSSSVNKLHSVGKVRSVDNARSVGKAKKIPSGLVNMNSILGANFMSRRDAGAAYEQKIRQALVERNYIGIPQLKVLRDDGSVKAELDYKLENRPGLFGERYCIDNKQYFHDGKPITINSVEYSTICVEMKLSLYNFTEILEQLKRQLALYRDGAVVLITGEKRVGRLERFTLFTSEKLSLYDFERLFFAGSSDDFFALVKKEDGRKWR